LKTDHKQKLEECEKYRIALNDAGAFVRKEYEEKLSQEQRKTQGYLFQIEENKFFAKIQQEGDRRFNEQLEKTIEQLIQQEMIVKKKTSPASTVMDRIKLQVQNLRQEARLFAQSHSRGLLLERVFQLASLEATKQIDNFINVNAAAYGNNVVYVGFKDIPLLRNPCLFNNNEQKAANDDEQETEFTPGNCPVAASFFKKCRIQQFAKAIDSTTGQLNTDLFSFTFHGTRGGVVAAKSIQCKGYDPKTRAGQAAGPGEYCAVGDSAFLTANGYAGGTAILVNLVYTPPQDEIDAYPGLHEVLDKAKYYGGNGATFFGPCVVWPGYMVIANPLNREDGTYMLPLGVLYNVEHLKTSFASWASPAASARCKVATTVQDVWEEIKTHKTCECGV
jgi:hypothetical protein